MIRRVALMIESDGPGGAETMFFTLASSLRQRGVEVFPVVLAGGPGWLSGRLRDAGFEVFQPTLRRAIDPGFVRTLRAWSRQKSISLVHTHEFAMAFYGGVAASLEGLPFVCTMHGGTGYAQAMRRRVALALVVRRSRALVGVSAETADALAKALWTSRDHIRVVPNGVADRPGDRGATRAQMGLGNQDRLILSVGNLYPVKGHVHLVDAAGLLKKIPGLPSWHVVVAGRGSEEARLLERIAHHGIQQRFRLLGLRDDIPDLLAAADIVVMPSLSEGMPMALLEAMFASKPVVCTRVGGIPEILKSGENGVLAEPADPSSLAESIAGLLRNPEHATTMGVVARAFVAGRFSDSAMTDSYLKLYQGDSA